jgi:ubiquinone/menaquinone biosynthesis C-methylase UbiE
MPVNTRTQVEDRTAVAAAEQAPQWNVQKMMEMHFGFGPSRVLSSAVELDLFTHLAGGKTTAGDLARAAGATERGTRMLLDALACLGLLTKRDGRYNLTDSARQHLLKDSPAYVGDFLTIDRLWDAWGHLTEAVRTGRPFLPVEQEDVASEFFPKLIRGLHAVHAEPARRAAQILTAGNKPGLRVLDIACGSAIWSIAIAELAPDARVTALDFPVVLESTREYVKKHRLEDRFEYLPGNLKDVDLGKQRYDLAILGNIIHTEGERSSRDLIQRVYGALAPGGRAVIIEMLPSDDRSGPVFPLLFALNMLVNSEQGDTYTFAELQQWLRQAGFQRVEATEIGSHSPMIVGYKP